MIPGIHTMPAEQYFAADGVSRSMLEWLTPPRTPAHFKAKYIDKLITDEETPALRIGSLTHRCILEPDTMGDAFHMRPEGIDGRTKDGKAWLAEHTDKPVLTADDAARITAMRDSVWSHRLAARILKHSEHERSAFAEENGLLLKSRFDCLPTTGNMIADLKTCDSADADSVNKSVSKWGYFRQAAFYLKVANLLGLKREVFAFVFVEKTPPYAVAVYQLDDTVIEAGRLTINRDLALLRRCRERNEWPGYGEELLTCALPKWEMKRLNSELTAA